MHFSLDWNDLNRRVAKRTLDQAIKERQDHNIGHLLKTLEVTKEEVDQIVAELGYRDIDDVYSESDASDYREQHFEIEMDNDIVTSLRQTFNK